MTTATVASTSGISDFVRLLGVERASAILRCHDQEVAVRAMEAALRGGFRIIEFTLTVPGVFDLIHEFARRPGVIVGAGTVLEPEEAERAVEAGARFVVSPVTDAAVIQRAVELGVDVMPGTHTPTEMLAAHRAGASLVKLFPAPAGGPAWVRSALAPLPFLRIVPTNGVDEHNVGEWLGAGAYAAGFAATLFEAEDLEAGRYDEIEARSRRILDRARPVT